MASTTKITGKHVLFAMIAFFGVIIVTNVIFITLAVQSFPGESQKKSYMQGLHYNDVLDGRAKQAALGWRAEIARAERHDDGGVIEIRMIDAADQPLNGLRLDGALKRPAHQIEDKMLTFNVLGEGRYSVEIPSLTPGVWDLSVKAVNHDGDSFDIDARVIIE